MVNDKRPSFFKIFFNGYSFEQLRIPPQFEKSFLRQVSDEVTLKGPFGGQWHVKLIKYTDGLYMEEGWKEFSSDHSLGKNEFLVFKYDGNMCFDVQIFDQSGCERVNRNVSVDVMHFHPNVSASRIPAGCAFPEGKRPRGRPRKGCIGSIHMQPLTSFIDNHDDDKGVGKRKAEGGTKLHIQSVKIAGPSTSRPLLTSFHQTNLPPYNAAESFTSKFPYFKSKVYSVMQYIPAYFSSRHLSDTKSDVVLINSRGKMWMVNHILIKSKHYFSGGWRIFHSDNNLEQGDFVIFELVGAYQMQVHIFKKFG